MEKNPPQDCVSFNVSVLGVQISELFLQSLHYDKQISKILQPTTSAIKESLKNSILRCSLSNCPKKGDCMQFLYPSNVTSPTHSQSIAHLWRDMGVF